MAEAKLTALTAVTTPVDADLLYFVQGVSTTPVSKKITWAVVKAFLGYPKSATVLIQTALVTAGSCTLGPTTISAVAFMNQYIDTATPANGNQLSWTVLLAAGTYRVDFFGTKFTDRGILDWTIDGAALVSGQDWYAASLVLGAWVAGGIVVTGNSEHTLACTVNGKHASSSNYIIWLTCIVLTRTGA